MNNLIITADDYGLSDSVNQAIDECLAAGALRSTCVMTNMPACPAAAGLRARFPHASLGLHWTLTSGRPALLAASVPSIVGPDGELLPFREFRRRFLARQVDPAHVRAELVAQHARFCELVGPPDYWNTHQNIHMTPGLFELMVELSRELGIPMMRSHRRITVPRRGSALAFNLRHPLYWLKGRLIARWSARAESRGLRMPDGVVHAPGFGTGKADVEAMLGCMRWRGIRRAAELIIHPATSASGQYFGSLTESRVREYQVFRDPALVARLAGQGVRAVGFEVLSGR